MKTLPDLLAPENLSEKLITKGIHLELTPALKLHIAEKVSRLLRHQPRIDRVRIDLEQDKTRGVARFVAKGRIEISGPDLIATVSDADAYKALDSLVDKLDASLRRLAGKKIGPRNDSKHQLPK